MKTPEQKELKRLINEHLPKYEQSGQARDMARLAAVQYADFCLKQREQSAIDAVKSATDELIFRGDYVAKLKELGAWEQFKENYKKEPATSIINLNLADSFYWFISKAFTWDETPQGDKFWIDISRK